MDGKQVECLSSIIAVLILGIVIIVHEFGHFLLAKTNGIVVEEFSVGMGPRILSTQRGTTRYSLKLIPFGGSCMMRGEDGEDNGEGHSTANLSGDVFPSLPQDRFLILFLHFSVQ